VFYSATNKEQPGLQILKIGSQITKILINTEKPTYAEHIVTDYGRIGLI